MTDSLPPPADEQIGIGIEADMQELEKFGPPDAMKAPVPQEAWNITLDKYQRDNLLWLLNACGYASPAIGDFAFGNTGDWLGEIALKLSPTGALLIGDRPNCSLEDLRKRVAQGQQ